jgi:two-component system LytT family sensor kinase
MKAFYNRNIGMDIMGWSILGITLFLIIPMLYPANLPLVYHIYHLVLFIVLIGIYYLNIRLVIPKTVHRSINFYYIILFFVMGALTVSLMSFVATYLNLQEEVYNRLYPENEFIVSEHKSYVNY